MILEGYISNIYNGIDNELHLNSEQFDMPKPYTRLNVLIHNKLTTNAFVLRDTDFDYVTKKKYRITIEEME